MNPRTLDWEEHEEHVATLYELLGYRVTRDVNAAGKQADMLCRREVPGGGHHTLLVDAKHTKLDRNTYVDARMVEEFANTFHARKDRLGWTTGVLVCNRSFSRPAKEVAALHPDLVLKTLDDLYEEALQLKPYLQSAVRGYEERGEFDDYIALTSRAVDDRLLPAGQALSIDSYVDRWLQSGQSRQLCVLGDFGSGKTTFLSRLHYRMARAYLEDSALRAPLLFRLRDYNSANDHFEIVQRFMANELVARVPHSIFEQLLRAGRFLILLDGFDEMGTAIDAASRKASYVKLMPFVGGLSGSSKVIITCRPAYFLTEQELRSVFSQYELEVGFQPHTASGETAFVRRAANLARVLHESIERHSPDSRSVAPAAARVQTSQVLRETEYQFLQLFDARQIESYVRKHEQSILRDSKSKMSGRALLARIADVYDLKDLAKRPILLKMIVATLPLFRETPKGLFDVDTPDGVLSVSSITPAILYHVYTEHEMIRETTKFGGRSVIARDRRRAFFAYLAHRMYIRGQTAIDREDFESCVAVFFSVDGSDLIRHATELRSCSFIMRDDTSFRFTHRSFLEYYAAQEFLAKMRHPSQVRQVLSEALVSEEVLYFLGYSILAFSQSMIGTLREIGTRLSNDVVGDRNCLHNMLALLEHAQYPACELENVTCAGISYHKHNLDLVSFSGCTFDRLLVDRTTMRHLKFTDSQVGDTAIKDATLSGTWSNFSTKQLRLANCSKLSLDATGCLISGISVFDCSLVQSSFRGGRVNVGEIRESRLEHVRFSNLIVTTGQDPPISESSTVDVSFDSCIFLYSNCDGGFFEFATFRNCVFVFCRKTDRFGLERLSGSKGMFIDDSDRQDASFNWNGQICMASRDAVLKPKRYPDGKALTWAQRLVFVFPLDRPSDERWSIDEVRERLRRVDRTSSATDFGFSVRKRS